MKKMFSKSPTVTDQLAEKETKLADVLQRLDDAKQNVTITEKAAVDAVLGDGAQDALVASAQAIALVRALEGAKARLDAEIVELRRRVLAEESAQTRAAAKPLMYALADELDAVEGEVKPLLVRYGELLKKGESILELHYSHSIVPGLNGMLGAAQTMKLLADQLRGTANVIEIDDPHDVYLQVARRVLASK